MATYRNETFSNLPPLTPRSRVQFGSTDRHIYNPTDSLTDNSFLSRPLSPTQNRRQIIEMQDKINAYREELSRKDKLIGQLTIHGPGIRTTFGETKTIDQNYANDYAATKSENARLQAQLRELQMTLEGKDDKIRELKLQLDASHETEARQNALIQSQRTKLVTYETEKGSLEGTANLSELSFQALQQEHREAQQRIIDLEARLRKHFEEREQLEAEKNVMDTKWLALVGQLRSSLPSSDVLVESTLAPEKLSAKILELVRENATLRGQLAVIKDQLAMAEADRDSQTETVKRLLSGVETDKNITTKQLIELESARMERDAAVLKQRELEAEVTRLADRLTANQLAFDTMRNELDSRLGQERELEGKEVLVRTTESAFKHFKESLAAMLSGGLGSVEPYEESIRERVRNLMQTLRDKTVSIDAMEKKITALTQHAEMQYEQQRNAEKRAKKAETDLMDLEDKLRRTQGIIGNTTSVLSDRDRFIRFIDRTMRTLGMEPATGEIGLEAACDAVLDRIDRLSRHDVDDVTSGRTHIGSLQRKINSLQEQLTNKDIHLDLLRKKVTQLEQRFSERSLVDEGTAIAQSQNLELVSTYRKELSEARMEIRNLRSRLAEFHTIRANRVEKEKVLQELEVKVGQLENVRQKQAQRIEVLKSKVEDKEVASNEKKALIHDSLQTLSNEVRNLKTTVRDLRHKERKLLELRQLTAKMLGLDANLMSIPDFEIISRLEKVILAAQANVTSNPGTVLFEMPPVSSMPYEFRSGYEEASRTTDHYSRSRSPTRKSPERHDVERVRSPSPIRRDKRTY